MIFLTNTNETLEVVLTNAISTHITVGWVEHRDSGAFPGSAQFATSASGTTTIVSAPGAGVQRQIKFISVKNLDNSVTQNVTIQKYNGTTHFELTPATVLLTHEATSYIDSIGFRVLTAAGLVKVPAQALGVQSVDVQAPAEGLTITGAPITDTGTLVFALDDDLAAVEGLTTTGIAARTADSTWTTRVIEAGSDAIVITPARS